MGVLGVSGVSGVSGVLGVSGVSGVLGVLGVECERLPRIYTQPEGVLLGVVARITIKATNVNHGSVLRSRAKEVTKL